MDEFKKELYLFIKEFNIKSLEAFIDEIQEIYEIERTQNGIIIKDYDAELYITDKEIIEIMEG